MALNLEHRFFSFDVKVFASRLFPVAWRFTMLLLPWQTRWFWEGSMLGGFPWEGGRVSVYVSWLPMIVTIVLFFVGVDSVRPSRRPEAARHAPLHPTTGIFFLLLFSLISTVYLPATLQWWMEVFLLAIFAWVTIQSFDRSTVGRWIVYAIVPHALLGIWQSFSQIVAGSKWLGIASQDPLARGVSVVEAAGQRWLRVYGGFPHPNIFGGWLVLGMAAVVSSIEYRVSRIGASDSLGDRRWEELLPWISLVLFSASLVLTFSRSAWLAAIIMMLIAGWTAFRSLKKNFLLKYLTVCVVTLVSSGVIVAWRWPLLVARTQPTTRLEARSIDERAEGWKNAMALFKHNPWLGVGPRATGYALMKEEIVSFERIPVIPHNVFLLMLDEIGGIGVVTLLVCFYLILPPASCLLLNPSFLAFLPIFLLDHYPWSTWSGISLTTMLFCFVLAQKGGLDTPSDRLAIYQHRD